MTWSGEDPGSGVMGYTEDGSPRTIIGEKGQVLAWDISSDLPKFINPGSLSGLASQEDIDNLANRTKSIFIWGNDSIGNSTTVRYATPGFADTLAEINPMRFVMPSISGVFRNMIVYHNEPQGNGTNVTYTLRVNDSGSPLAVTMPSTATSGSNLGATVNVAREDIIDVVITKAGNLGSAPRNVVISVEFA